MTPALLFIHGRSQASEDEVARDPKRLEAYILGKKRKWLGGLAKGLIGAGGRPADESSVLFPFYGNEFADAIKAYEAGGGRRPELEIFSEDPAEDARGNKGSRAPRRGKCTPVRRRERTQLIPAGCAWVAGWTA